jgi:hypothetical protein
MQLGKRPYRKAEFWNFNVRGSTQARKYFFYYLGGER